MISVLLHGFVLLSINYVRFSVGTADSQVVELDVRYVGRLDSRQQVSLKSQKASPSRKKVSLNRVENSPKKIQVQDAVESSMPQTGFAAPMESGLLERITRWPQILYEEKLEYPEQAKINGVEGIVTIRLVVNEKGEPTDIQVIDGPGFGLNEAAVESIKKFRFEPALAGAASVAAPIVYKYKFAIR